MCKRLDAVIRSVGESWEVVFVNDGSTDESLAAILSLRSQYPFLRVVDLSRNFGHQPALTAGLDHASGAAIIMMDADLQDTPEALPLLIDQWKAGSEVVYAIRKKRKESLPLRFAFRAFYYIQTRGSRVKTPPDAGIFSLIDRKVLDAMRSMPERHRYLAGLRAYAGFRQSGVEVERGRRFAGDPKVGIRGLFRLAMDGIFAFSTYPLRIILVAGIVIAVCSLAVGAAGLYYRFVVHRPLLDWPFGLTTAFFFGGVQLISIGIIGEYVGRIYDEVKKRPYYIVRSTYGIDEAGRAGPGENP